MKRIKLRSLLMLQILYAALGVGYNVVSQASVMMGGRPFSSTSPWLGGISLLVYGLLLTTGFKNRIGAYRVLMALSIVAFGYGGIIKHLMNFMAGDLWLYSSWTAFVLAVLINVFGLILNLTAAAGWFERD